VGLSGVFTEPFQDNFGSVAATALASIGGTARARVENFEYRDIVSFKSAQTNLVGREAENGVHSTLTTTTIEGLNVMNVLLVDRIVLRMASLHFMDPKAEASIRFVGSHFDNLRVAGQDVDIHYDAQVLAEWNTFSRAKRGYLERYPDKQKDEDDIDTLPLSIVDAVRVTDGLSTQGNRIDFPDFGSIYLGEVVIQEEQRRITMMRVVLGCPHHGIMCMADGDGNDQPINP
jgi:hypothetical protein